MSNTGDENNGEKKNCSNTALYRKINDLPNGHMIVMSQKDVHGNFEVKTWFQDYGGNRMEEQPFIGIPTIRLGDITKGMSADMKYICHKIAEGRHNNDYGPHDSHHHYFITDVFQYCKDPSIPIVFLRQTPHLEHATDANIFDGIYEQHMTPHDMNNFHTPQLATISTDLFKSINGKLNALHRF